MNNKDELKIYKKSIESLRDVVKIQCSDGNWNYDPYMHGMANGLILALSYFQEGECIFLEPPEKWGYENPDKSDVVSEENIL